MDVIEAIHGRRSIRAYRSDPVDRALIEAIILDAAQAPPPFAGLVPWSFTVIEGVDRIAALGARAWQFAREHRPDGAGWSWLDRTDFDIFWGAPTVIVISGRVEDCCRAGQNLMLSAHARCLGSCWVGSPMLWLRSAAAKTELGIAAELTPVSALCLGYAAAMPETATRPRPPIHWA